MELQEFIKLFDSVVSGNNGSYKCRCPAHDDNTASMSIYPKDDGIAIKCFAGCDTQSILDKVGLKKKDLFYNNDSSFKPKATPIAQYDYIDLNGVIRHSSLKYINSDGKKSFKQCGYIEGKKVWSLQNIDTILYKLPELVENVSLDRQIFIVEGEKDVETLYKLGLSATSNPMGAGKWKSQYNEYFKDAKVVILPDNDKPGLTHAQNVKENLLDFASEIKIVKLPGLIEKQDVTDWLELGHTKEELLQLVDSTRSEAELKEEKIAEIRQQNDEHREIETIRETIYHFDGKKATLIDKYVIAQLLDKYNICCSKVKKEMRYYIYSDGFWKETNKDYICSLFANWLYDEDQKAKTLSEIVNLLSKTKGVLVDYEIFNSRWDLINLKNCAYNLLTYSIEEHNPKHYFTFKNNYDYNAKAKCPIFDKNLILYSCNYENWINAFWEITGYILTGDFPYQKMFWYTGKAGRNGKGTLIRIQENLVGDFYTIPGIDPRDLRQPFYMTRLIGKRLATTGDLHHTLCNVATMKSLTGGDRQTTDVKYGDAKPFLNNAKMILAMNGMPTLPPNENLRPVIKRIEILPFNYEIEKEDSEIENKFVRELPGIFNKAIEGLKRLRKNKGFSKVPEGLKMLDIYAGEGNVIDYFIDNYVIYDKNHVSSDDNDDDSKGLFLNDVWAKFLEYMNQIYGSDKWTTDKEIPVRNSPALGKKIKEHYPEIKSKRCYDEYKQGTQKIYIGLRWKVKDDFVNEKDFTNYKAPLNINDDVPF